jgi:hypothetical protein
MSSNSGAHDGQREPYIQIYPYLVRLKPKHHIAWIDLFPHPLLDCFCRKLN